MRPSSFERSLRLPSCVTLLAAAVLAQDPFEPGAASGYRLPPANVVAIVDAEPTPFVVPRPDGRVVLRVHQRALPSIEEVAQPFSRLAGLRIHPRRYERRTARYVTRFALQDVATGETRPVQMPPGERFGFPSWAPDGKRFAFTRSTDEGVELWIGEADTGACRRLWERVNDTYGDPFRWWSGSERLLVRTVPDGLGAPPEPPTVPTGPVVEQTAGKQGQNRTYQDLLQSPHDEAMFEHELTVQLVEVRLDGRMRPVGEPNLFGDAAPSPDGRFVLVERLHPPWSYVVPVYRFAHTTEVWDREGTTVARIADLPVADEVPIGGVPVGPRSVSWRDDRPATLVWAEALDEGDPDVDVPHRDRLLQWAASFDGERGELARTVQRFSGIEWTDRPGLALVREYDRDRRWATTTLHRFDEPGFEPVVVWDRSIHDRYGDPGDPVHHLRADGTRPVRVDDGRIYLEGRGAGPDGERPFLDALDLESLRSERLFRSPAEIYTAFAHFVGDDGEQALFLRESPTDPPNFFVGTPSGEGLRALTDFPDPHPQLTGIEKELVRYQRDDGVPLSGTLYLPPDRQPGRRLPLIVWAYPIEYTNAAIAGQVRSTSNRFTRFVGLSPLMLLTQGYAVLDDAAMPVVGDPETMNDTFVDQIVAAARAAIETLAAREVIDPDRVAVAGHSYGAFMTVNLLAHSDLFRAGIARSGAYNRSLTPFGFQSERRTLWEAPNAYTAVSPFFHADRIDEPLLLIHGEVDDNSGTFPLQSKRLFHALQGLGGTARLVLLPHEAHSYAARESVLHVLAEEIEWLDRYVKNVPPRSLAGGAQEGGR